jgi:hypothetical protein
MAIVPIRELLDLQGNPMPIVQIKHSRKYGPHQYGDRILVPVHTFGESKEVIKSLLRLLYHPQELSKGVKLDPSIWRALWIRMSSREHDVLYSSMDLFSTPVQLDIDYQKTSKVSSCTFLEPLHEKPSVPYWLSIGHRIPVCEWSGLLPKRPCFKKHEVPTYTIGKSEPVDAQELLCSRGCCSSLHLCVEITGASKETGHTLCAKVLKLVRVVKTQTLPTYTDRCWQHVRKVLISYITGRSGAAKGENWTFETDADAVAAGVDTYSYFNEDACQTFDQCKDYYIR